MTVKLTWAGAGIPALLLLSALAVAGCKEDKDEATAETPAAAAADCEDGANKMFAEDKAAQAEKFDKCMTKKLGADWQEKNPELKPAE